jgi:hypothetical protein
MRLTRTCSKRRCNNAMEMLWFAIDSLAMAINQDARSHGLEWRKHMEQVHQELDEAKGRSRAVDGGFP